MSDVKLIVRTIVCRGPHPRGDDHLLLRFVLADWVLQTGRSLLAAISLFVLVAVQHSENRMLIICEPLRRSNTTTATLKTFPMSFLL